MAQSLHCLNRCYIRPRSYLREYVAVALCARRLSCLWQRCFDSEGKKERDGLSCLVYRPRDHTQHPKIYAAAYKIPYTLVLLRLRATLDGTIRALRR
jgi:hypothetical protein